jgi:general secretion pathway protein A
MVLDYYKLQEQPFGVTPDSRYLFLNPTYKEALTSLIYGIEEGCGFVALIATPGLGKTTLLFQTLDLLRDKARIVFLFQTISSPLDLMRALLSGLGVRQMPGNLVEMQLRLKDLLTEQYRMGKRVVLVIDEAQNLDDSVLELVRMLSNFETSRDKLIQIILSGQPQLAENIGSPELLQLRQRVSIFARLKPFTAEETALYVAHRLRIAGCASDMPVFTKDALALIAQCSEGIPRNINNLCFNAMSLGCALQQKPIDRYVIREVVADLDLGPWRKTNSVAVQPEEKSTPNAPAIFSTGTPSASAGKFASWLPKVAASIVVLLALSGALFEGYRWLSRPVSAQPAAMASVPSDTDTSAQTTPTASAQQDLSPPNAVVSGDSPASVVDSPPTAQANSPVQQAISRASSSSTSTTDPTSQPGDSAGIVLVTPGRTLLGICVEKFGTCTPELLQQIHELNPTLSNPDHIESGQKIRIPVLAAQSNGSGQAQ